MLHMFCTSFFFIFFVVLVGLDFFAISCLFWVVLLLMDKDLICEDLQERLRRNFAIVDDHLYKEWLEKDGVSGLPVSKLL